MLLDSDDKRLYGHLNLWISKQKISVAEVVELRVIMNALQFFLQNSWHCVLIESDA